MAIFRQLTHFATQETPQAPLVVGSFQNLQNAEASGDPGQIGQAQHALSQYNNAMQMMSQMFAEQDASMKSIIQNIL